MQSTSLSFQYVPHCPTSGTLRHASLLAALLLATNIHAQQASLTNTLATSFGAAVLDSAGNPYLFEFGPVTPGAAQTANGGGTCLGSNGFFSVPGPCSDAYVGKLDAAGKLVFGTFLGGPTADHSTALAIDPVGNVFVTGTTEGSFPTTPGAAIASSTTARSFAAKLSPDGSHVLYATYLPDTAAAASAIAIDALGNAYIAGKSSTGHAFALKLNSDGSAFAYNVSLAGAKQDSATAIAADSSGNVSLTGLTTSPDFPVSSGALQTRLKGTQNLFVARLDSTGQVVFSTYLGGSGADTPVAVRLDSAGNIYVAGQTTSFDFPTTSGSFQPAPIVPLWNISGPGGFAAKLSSNGSALAWSTYVMSYDYFYAQRGVTQLAVSPSGETYVSGLTGAGFPVTPTAPQLCYDGSTWVGDPAQTTRSEHNVFVAHLDSRGALHDATYAGRNAVDLRGMSLSPDGTVNLLSSSSGGVVKSQLRFSGPTPATSACLSPNVLNSATMSNSLFGVGAAPGLVPGEAITLTGFGIGPESGVASQADSQGRTPRQVAGVQVLFDGQPAPVLYVQSRQINVLAPVELTPGKQIAITVIYNQTQVGSIQANVAAFGYAGIFRLQPGVSAQAAAINQDGTLNTLANPAARGSVVSFWGTGFGLTDPACTTGGINPLTPANLAVPIAAFIADGTPPGQPVEYAAPLYAGSAPNLSCGIVQLNFQIPTYVSAGEYHFFPWSAMKNPAGDMVVTPGNVGDFIYVK